MFATVEGARSAWESIVAHALRSFLTTLGIAIGVASVVAVIGLMQGMQASIAAQFEGLGGNSLSIAAFTPVEDRLKGKVARLTPDDLDRIAERVDGIASITPLLSLPLQAMAEMRHGTQVAFAAIQGTTHTYQQVYNAYVQSGRFLSPADDQRRRRVCVLGEKTRENLGLEEPIGAYVEMGGEWLKVVGVMESRGELFGISQDDYALLPYSTLRSMNDPLADTDIAIQVAIAEGADRTAVKARITQLLRHGHGLQPGEPDDFDIQSPEQISAAFGQIGTALTAVVASIVGISLVVGGIGIMNIMLVSVVERTREIGILKALGATRRQILMQFLIEALALAVLGGAVGLAVGFGLAAAVTALVPSLPPAAVPLWAVALSLGFSGLVGVAFGILPASQAANLHPIEALRYE